jgi:urease accessory protein
MNLRLLQLVSPSLPVGAYSYSQGLEAAIETGAVTDAASAGEWIGDVMQLALGAMEAPVFLRLAGAWARRDLAAVREWNALFVASRESAELRAETLQMGYSLRALLRDLAVEDAQALEEFDELAFPTAFTFAVVAWEIEPGEALQAYLFGWLENQVLAAVKAVPLGQTQAQRLLLDLARGIPPLAAAAAGAVDDELGNFAPGLAILASGHETQYSRLFRS